MRNMDPVASLLRSRNRRWPLHRDKARDL